MTMLCDDPALQLAGVKDAGVETEPRARADPSGRCRQHRALPGKPDRGVGNSLGHDDLGEEQRRAHEDRPRRAQRRDGRGVSMQLSLPHDNATHALA